MVNALVMPDEGEVLVHGQATSSVDPIELRRTLDIAEKDSLEIYMDGPSIVLRKYQPACIFCDDAKDVIMFHGKNICPKCIKALQESLTQE